MAENDAIRDDYEDKYLGGGEDDVTERLADIDDETAEARAQALLEGLEDYDLDEEDRALLGAWGFELDEEEEQLADPVVAIVGRPNVGKSTIINRILGRREAVVEDKPGVTRDRVSYKAEWLDKRFTLVDTGGWESDARGIDAQVADQAEIAVEQADVVILVVDARVGITASDEQIVRMLRRVKKPIILMANKIDDAHLEPEIYNLWSLGMGQPFPVSGLHGRGLADALDELLEVMPEHSQYAQPDALGGPRRVALIGRPNVGKSSLLNKLAGSERAVVNDLAGTTRDPIDEVIELGGYPWRFIDTAGIRRRQHMAKGAEFYSSLRTQTALERSEVAVVLLDVSEPLSEQDVRIIQTTIDSGRAMVLALGTISPAVAHENTSDASATAQIPAHEEMNTPMGAGERARLAESQSSTLGKISPNATSMWTPTGGTLGMDVSSYQGNVDWNRAYNMGSRFAYTKATEGNYYTNPYFAQQYNGSAQSGMIRGAYHFANPRSTSGAEQARYFVRHGGGWSNDGITMPGLLDIEYNPYPSLGNTCYNMSSADLTRWIRDFMETYRSLTGRYPMIYTANYWWRQCVGATEFGNHLLHLANYNYYPGPMPAGWGNYDIWQFSSEGPFVGDSNFFPGTVHDLRALATNAGAKNRSWHPQPAPRVETAPKTRFRDVPQSSPFYKEIEWLANEKITTGWPDGTFRPDAGVERAAMAAYFYRMAGSPPVNLPARSPFRDVAPQDQFYREIVWMHQQGIATGWADGTFRPWQPVERGAMAAFIYRYKHK